MTTAGLLGRIAVAILWSSSTLAAQQPTRRPVKSARPVAARPVTAPPKPTVLVMPVVSDAGDSVRTIIQRDLDYGDRLAPVNVSSSALRSLLPATGAAPNLSALSQYGAKYVVVPRRSGDRLQVVAYDAKTMRVVGERDFEMPEVPTLRPEAIRDSRVRAYAERDSAARARIAVLAATRDSLLRAAGAAQDSKKRRGQRDQAAAAARDSQLRAIAAEDSALRAQIAQLASERDLSLPVSQAADTARRQALLQSERMALHAASDEIHLWLTGKRGIAQSRIAYARDGQLRVVDSDGANDRPLTNGGRSLSPSWHPSGRSLVFSDMADAGTQIAEVDLSSGDVRFLGATPRGLNMTPVYTPDGERIVYSTGTSDGGYRLVSAARGSRTAVPVPGIVGDATSPSFSPDGRQLAFISPRPWTIAGGSPRLTPQLFTVGPDGKAAGQLTPSTYGVRSYRTSPDWSPDGQYVAYMQQNRDFQVWVISVRDKKMRRLTNSAENEDPTWGPDSRHMAVASNRSGRKEIWVLDIETGRARQVTRGGAARLPAWSPPLERPAPVFAASGGSK